MTSDIFLSYATEDRDTARRVAHALEAIGWSVWWDREIPTGKSFTEVIKAELDGSRCALVLWSADSVASRWVKREAKRADDQKKLFPVLIEDVMPPWVFEELQACDLISWDGSATGGNFPQLVSDMGRILGTPPKLAGQPHGGPPPVAVAAPAATEPSKKRPPGGRSRYSWLRYAAAALTVVVVALLLVVRPWANRPAARAVPAAIESEAARPAAAETAIDRRAYRVSVLGVPNATDAIAAIRAAGYVANQYGPSGRSADDFQVISIGSKVPARVAQELLPIARRHLPGLRYVVISEDRPSVAARGGQVGGREVSREISLAVTNRALADFRQVTPLPAAGWQRLLAAADDRTFMRTIRAYYKVD